MSTASVLFAGQGGTLFLVGAAFFAGVYVGVKFARLRTWWRNFRLFTKSPT